MSEAAYEPFKLISPDAPGMYTFGVASLSTGAARVLLLIETLQSSERHFWEIPMAKHMLEQLQIQIGNAEKQGDLTIVQNSNKLIVPGQADG